MSEAEKIAAALTKAQARNLAAFPDNAFVWSTVSEMRHKGATGAGMDILHVWHTPKLSERRWTQWGSEPGQKRGEGYEYRITPLGTEVRAILRRFPATEPERTPTTEGEKQC